MGSDVIGSVLVAGGGIAGIQASLDLANSGYKVYMVERASSIGGIMAQLDKTFPTNDCSMCIMSPKLVEVGRHDNIELITLGEITEVRGEKGNFEVDVLQRPRYVDPEKCIACGDCTTKCPVKVEDSYNASLNERKAIYVLYPQAVPLKYAIDAEHCIKLTKDKCGACQKKLCPKKAIDFEEQPKNLTLNVGSIILAPGSEAFDPAELVSSNYTLHPNVVTSLEFERILSASGPTKGHLVRRSDGAEAKRIAWLQCVGSRDLSRTDHGYCSSVCCMYAIKEAIIAKEHAHDPIECAIFYMDMRTHGKDFEACYNDAKSKHDIRFVRARVHSVAPDPEKEGDLKLTYVSDDGKVTIEPYDMVVLSVGLQTPKHTLELGKRLGLELTAGNFCRTDAFSPVATSRPGIYVCGAFQGPKDIPQSVIEASSAALCAGTDLVPARDTLTVKKEPASETDVTGERPRVGVFICHCGSNIGGVVDVPAVAAYAATLPFVVHATDNLYSCSQDAQDLIAAAIEAHKLNRVVVSACSPKTHEPLFQETLQAAGLNKYLFEFANIRNHVSWVHKENPTWATEKAKDLTRMAVAKVASLIPLSEAELEIDQAALVIGGGIAGMVAAKSLAEQGYEVHLVEREQELGGQARSLLSTWRGESVQQNLHKLASWLEANENTTIHLGSELAAVEGFVGNFNTTLAATGQTDGGNGEGVTIRHGVAIVANGARAAEPTEYLYGKDPRVLTHQQLDKRFIDNDPSLVEINNAAFIQCVGSREPERPYCSRLCCTHTVKSALQLKRLKPEMNVFVLYRDIRTYSERELLYQQAREAGVVFIKYDLDSKPQVEGTPDGPLQVTVMDHILREPVTIEVDLLTLASAIVPYRDEKLAQMFKVPLNKDGFFLEAHVKLSPNEFATDGVFLCGMTHYPKPIDEAVAQAQAAASRATTLLARKKIRISGTVAETDGRFCARCGVCVQVCPYNAPSFIAEGPNAGKAEVNPMICKGCGLCVASCRSGALTLRGFEEAQLMAQITEAW